MTETKGSAPRGDCFEAAGKFISRPSIVDYPDDYRLVHGNVAKLRQDEPLNHAWTEEGDLVHEVSKGRRDVYSKAAYYTSIESGFPHSPITVEHAISKPVGPGG
jgi:hypothetical protein